MIDSHAHLTDKAFVNDKDVINRAKSVGVKTIVTLGWNISSSEDCRAMAENTSDIYFASGVHPSDCEEFDNGVIARLFKSFESKKCIAEGEIGLDYHYGADKKELQKTVFKKQVEIAKDANLPFVIHSREASGDMVNIVTESDKAGLLQNGFLMHCYSESKESAKIYLDMGAYFAFGGVITFKNAKKEEIIKSLPTDRIMFETDCPYMAPVPHRGETNEPAYVKFVYEKAAEILNLSFEKLEEIAAKNAQNLFKKAEFDI